MKFSIASREFSTIVSRLQGVVDKKSTLPLLSNLLIEATQDRVLVTGTDLGIGIRITSSAIVQEPGRVTLSAKKLHEIVRETEEGELSFELLENEWVKISCKNSYFRLIGMTAENFPQLTEFTEENIYQLSVVTFREMLQMTEFSVSFDMSRVVFTGIQFVHQDGKLKMTATDGHRLAIISRSHDGVMANCEQIIPRKTCQELLRNCENIDGMMSIGWTDSKIMFQIGDTYLVSNLVEGKYPNMEKALPTIQDKIVTFNRTVISGAIRRAAIFSDKESYGIRFDIEPDRMKIQSSDPDQGDSREEIEVSYEGPSMVMGFNAKYLLDVFSILNCEDVMMKFSDASSSALIVNPEDPDFIYLLMPMKI